MRVLVASTSYPSSPADWRGRFIAALVDALACRPDLSLSLWAPSGESAQGITLAATASDHVWLEQLMDHGGIAHVLRTHKFLAIPTVLSLLFRLGRTYRRQSADVIHVNWLQNALPLWGTTTPALITVLGTDFMLLRLPGMKSALRSILRQRRAILAPNADWMQPALELAFGDLAQVRLIPFGVDAAWFEVRRTPRKEGIHEWLCVTRLTKGKIGDLFSWGEGFFGTSRRLHLFGPMQEQVDIPGWVEYHGPTYPAELQDTWFPKATGLISLSRHDEGRPQVMLEAMAASLPVLASDLPAHRSLLMHRKTGCLAASRDEMRQGLDWLENPELNTQAGQAARYQIRETIGCWGDCAERYASAYRSLLENHK